MRRVATKDRRTRFLVALGLSAIVAICVPVLYFFSPIVVGVNPLDSDVGGGGIRAYEAFGVYHLSCDVGSIRFEIVCCKRRKKA